MTAWFPALLRSEWRKIATTKTIWILALTSVAYTAVQVGALVLVLSQALPGANISIDRDLLMDPQTVTSLVGAATSSSIFVLVIGIIGMTGEYRHMTITSTFLATPRRTRVLLAKVVVYAVIGAVVAVLAVAGSTVTALLLLIGKAHAPLTIGTVGTVLWGALLGMALYAVLGISVGALIRSQVAAIVIALVWVALLEAVVALALPAVGKWLPGGALSAAMNSRLGSDFTEADLLPAWLGALVLAGYSLAFLAIASQTTIRRDIT